MRLRSWTRPSSPRRRPDAGLDRVRKKSLVPVRRALVLVALLTLGLAAWTTWRYVRGKAAVSPIRSIAVLPSSNLSGDPSEEYFADGMTDQLITDLAKIGSLRVISRTSVMQYKGTRKSLPEIARELNVDAIVEGSVIRSGRASTRDRPAPSGANRPAHLGRDLRSRSRRYSEAAE